MKISARNGSADGENSKRSGWHQQQVAIMVASGKRREMKANGESQ